MNLNYQIRKGLKVTTISMIIISICQFLQLAILARYLTIDEFGLMSLIIVFTGFAQSFQDMGLSNAIIQHQNINNRQLSSLYWLNILFGIFLCALIFTVSSSIANFYGRPELEYFISILSIVFPITAVGAQYRSLLHKEMRFFVIELADVIASLISIIIVFTLANNGYGIISLVYAMIAKSSLTSLIFITIGFREIHIPSLIFDYKQTKNLLNFGMFQMGERTLNYLSANIDKILIAKFAGINAVGIYSLAWQVIIFPLLRINPIVNKVAFPVYSKIQTNKAELDNYYTLSMKLVSLLTIPILIFLIFFPHSVLQVIFGDGWGMAADLMPLLAIVGIFKVLGSPAGPVILAVGRADVSFWWNLVWVISVFLGISFALMLSPNPQSAVIALFILSLTIGLIWHVIVARIAKVSYVGILLFLIRFIPALVLIIFFTSYIIKFIGFVNPIFEILSSLFICICIYCTYLYMFERRLIFNLVKG